MSSDRTFASNAAALFVVGIFSQLVTIGGLIVLARIFTPEYFGSLATVVSASVILVTIVSGRFDVGIVVDGLDARAAQFAQLVIWLSVLGGACISIACGVAAASGMMENMTTSLAAGIWFLPAIVIASGVNLAGLGCATRRRRFRLIAASQFAGAIGTFLGQYGASFLLPATVALPAGYVAGQVCGIVFLLPAAYQLVASTAAADRSLRSIRTAIIEGRTYPLHVTPYSFMAQLYAQVPQLLTTFFFGVPVGGQYSNAVRLTFAPMTLLPAAIGQVLFGEMSRNPGDPRWGHRVAMTTLVSGLVLSPFVAALACAGPELMTAALGPQWDLSGHLSRVVVAGGLTVALVAGHDRIFDVFGVQRLRLLLILSNISAMMAVLGVLGATKAPLMTFMGGLVVVQMAASVSWGMWALRSARVSAIPWLKALACTVAAVTFWLVVFELIELRALIPALVKILSRASQ